MTLRTALTSCVAALWQVLFYMSPVNRLVGALMTVLSLFPGASAIPQLEIITTKKRKQRWWLTSCDACAGMIEHGLVDSSHYRPKGSVSEDATLADSVLGCEEFVSVTASDIADATAAAAHQPPSTSEGDEHLLKPPSRTSPESSESDWETLDPSVLDDGTSSGKDAEVKEAGSGVTEPLDPQAGTPITVQPQAASEGALVQGLVSGLEEDQYGLPLPIFTKVAPQRHLATTSSTIVG